jgi:heme-degrading monooxygenase HmoA
VEATAVNPRRKGEKIMAAFVEMDETVSIGTQLEDQNGPVILINKFTINPVEAEQLLAAWADDAAWMKQQPGFISTQLYRGIAGSGVFLNYAVWESAAHFRTAFTNPEFQAKLVNYPSSVTASPHLFRKVAVSGVCLA